MSVEGRSLARQLADCHTPRECVYLMRLLEDEHAREIDALQGELSSLRTEHDEIASQLVLLVKVVDALEKKLADPMDLEQAMDEPTDLAAVPSAANGSNPHPWEAPDGPLPDNVKVGAIWGKRKKPNHEIVIESISWNGKTSVGTHRRVNGRRSWHQKYNGPISVTTLLADYMYSRVSNEYVEKANKQELVRLPPNVYNISAWVLEQLNETTADATDLTRMSSGLAYKSKGMTRVQIAATLSHLSRQSYVERLNIAGEFGITDAGRDELRLRETIVTILCNDGGPMSVTEICRNLRMRFGNKADESAVKSSLNSLECSQRAERFGTSWKAKEIS